MEFAMTPNHYEVSTRMHDTQYRRHSKSQVLRCYESSGHSKSNLLSISWSKNLHKPLRRFQNVKLLSLAVLCFLQASACRYGPCIDGYCKWGPCLDGSLAIQPYHRPSTCTQRRRLPAHTAMSFWKKKEQSARDKPEQLRDDNILFNIFKDFIVSEKLESFQNAEGKFEVTEKDNFKNAFFHRDMLSLQLGENVEVENIMDKFCKWCKGNKTNKYLQKWKRLHPQLVLEDTNLLESLRNMGTKQKEKRREIIATRNAIKNKLSDGNSSNLFIIMEKNRKKAMQDKRTILNTTGVIDRREMKLAKEFLVGKSENAKKVFEENVTMFSQREKPKKTNTNQTEKPKESEPRTPNTTTPIDNEKIDRTKCRVSKVLAMS